MLFLLLTCSTTGIHMIIIKYNNKPPLNVRFLKELVLESKAFDPEPAFLSVSHVSYPRGTGYSNPSNPVKTMRGTMMTSPWNLGVFHWTIKQTVLIKLVHNESGVDITQFEGLKTLWDFTQRRPHRISIYDDVTSLKYYRESQWYWKHNDVGINYQKLISVSSINYRGDLSG